MTRYRFHKYKLTTPTWTQASLWSPQSAFLKLQRGDLHPPSNSTWKGSQMLRTQDENTVEGSYRIPQLGTGGYSSVPDRD